MSLPYDIIINMSISEKSFIEVEDTYKTEELTEIFNQYGIHGLCIDIDNTIMKTGEYYDDNVFRVNQIIEREFFNNQKIGPYISKFVWEFYQKSGHQPIYIQDLYRIGVARYLELQEADMLNDMSINWDLERARHLTIPKKIENLIEFEFRNFYLQVPDLKEDAEIFLRTILSTGRKFVFNTNAQDDWTKRKVREVDRRIRFIAPYVATSIDSQKDYRSWLRSFQKLNEVSNSIFRICAENVLVIGDNFTADIYESMNAGYKNFVWLNKSIEEPFFRINKDGSLFIMSPNLLGITDVLTSSL